MADRRTTVVVDIQAGDIILPAGQVPIQATLNLNTTQAQGEAKKDAEALAKTIEKTLAGLVGQAWARQIVGFFTQGIQATQQWAIALATKLGPAIAGVGLILAGLIGVIKVLAWWSKKVLELFGLLVRAIKAVGNAIYDANAAMLRLIALPLRPALLGSVEALKWLVQGAMQAGRAIYDLTERVIRNAVEVGAEFEQQVANTATAMGAFGAAGIGMRDWLAQAAIGMTRLTTTLPTEAMRTMWDVASAGFSKFTDMVNVSRAAITLANATLERMSDTGRVLISVLNAYGLATADADRVANALAATAVKSATDIGKLIQSLKYVAPVAHQFGISLEQTLAALGALAQQGILASQAGTGLRAMLFNLAAQTDKAHKAFVKFAGGEEELGEIFQDLSAAGMDPQAVAAVREQLRGIGEDLDAINPAYHSIVEIVRVFERLTKGRDPAQVIALIAKAFNVRSAQTLMALLTTGSKGLEEMEQQITGTNLAYQMQWEQLNSLQGQWKVLLNLWEVARIEISRGIGPVLREFVGTLQLLADWGSSTGFFQTLGRTAGQYLMMFAKPLAVLGGPVLKAVPLAVEWLGRAFEFMGEKFALAARDALPTLVSFLQTMLEMLPRVANDFMVIGLWLLQRGLPLFLKWAQMAGPMLLTIFENLGNALMGLIDSGGGQLLLDWFKQLLQFGINLTAWLPNLIPLALQFGTALKEWAASLFGIVTTNLPSLLQLLRMALPLVISFVSTYLPILAAEVGRIFQVLQHFAETALPAIVTAFQTAQPLIIELLGKVAGAVDSVTDSITKLVKSVTEGLPGIATLLKEVFGFIKDNADKIMVLVLNALEIQMKLKAMDLFGKIFPVSPTMAWDVLKMAWEAGNAIGKTSNEISSGRAAMTAMERQAATAAEEQRRRMNRNPASGFGGRMRQLREGREALEAAAAARAMAEPASFSPRQMAYGGANGAGGTYVFAPNYNNLDAVKAGFDSWYGEQRAREQHVRATRGAAIV